MATTIGIPPILESGDRLAREEFHRRYCARPDIHKAELILGVVYVASPARDEHGKPHNLLSTWLGTYVSLTPGVEARNETTVFLANDGEVQPDCFIFRAPPVGQAVRRNEKGYLEGAPELVVEIAASSASYDLHDKKELYRRAGVEEYIVWRVLDNALDWFDLRDGDYVRRGPDEHGVIESRIFPGLRLNVPRLLAGDYAGVLAELTVRS